MMGKGIVVLRSHFYGPYAYKILFRNSVSMVGGSFSDITKIVSDILTMLYIRKSFVQRFHKKLFGYANLLYPTSYFIDTR